MKRDKLIERQSELLKAKYQCDVDHSKVMRDTGFLPWLMRANKQKIMDELESIELELNKPEPVKKVTAKKSIKKEVKKDEEKTTEK